MTAISIVRAGWATTIQDRGRSGFGHLGVPRAGAADRVQLEVLNRLVGNDPGAAGLETAGGLVVRFSGPALVATSAERAPRSVGDTDEVRVEPSPGDLYGYLAVRGGIDVDPVLGSRSQDTLAGVGPPAIDAEAELPIGADPGTTLTTDQAPPRPRRATVDVWRGPRADWFASAALDRLTATVWTVSGDVSRVGVRLDGPPLARADERELPSEGLVLGAIQVPPDGVPIVMLADHPTTGGYPVLAVVDPADVATVAQARPGATLRFRLRS